MPFSDFAHTIDYWRRVMFWRSVNLTGNQTLPFLEMFKLFINRFNIVI